MAEREPVGRRPQWYVSEAPMPLADVPDECVHLLGVIARPGDGAVGSETWSRRVLALMLPMHRALVLAEISEEKARHALLSEAVLRADRLGWRTLAMSRLRRLYRGDTTALPEVPGEPA